MSQGKELENTFLNGKDGRIPSILFMRIRNRLRSEERRQLFRIRKVSYYHIKCFVSSRIRKDICGMALRGEACAVMMDIW